MEANTSLRDIFLDKTDSALTGLSTRPSLRVQYPQIYRAGDTVEFTSISFTCAIETLYENIEQLS